MAGKAMRWVHWVVVGWLLAGAGSARAYIAVVANRLTLPEVMLEFPTTLSLKLDKFDAARGAYVFQVVDTLQGKPVPGPIRYDLGEAVKKHEALGKLKVGDSAVIFMGSPDRRSLTFVNGGWFISHPDQNWERFGTWRADFSALCLGPATELAQAVRSLARGGVGDCRIQIAEGGGEVIVRYDAQFPHRRFARPDPRSTGDLKSANPVARYQACARLVGDSSQAAANMGALLSATEGPNAMVRAAAVEALLTVKSPTVLARMTRLLEDDDRFVCALAARVIGNHGKEGASAVPRLVASLGDRNSDFDFRPHRAAEAAEAILRITPDGPPAKQAIELLLSNRMLDDERIDSEGTRAAAARALGRVGPAARPALTALERRLKDPLPATRISAAEAILLVDPDGNRREQASKVLALALDDRTPAIAIQAARAIVSTRLHELKPTIRARGEAEKDPEVRALLKAIADRG